MVSLWQVWPPWTGDYISPWLHFILFLKTHCSVMIWNGKRNLINKTVLFCKNIQQSLGRISQTKLCQTCSSTNLWSVSWSHDPRRIESSLWHTVFNKDVVVMAGFSAKVNSATKLRSKEWKLPTRLKANILESWHLSEVHDLQFSFYI